MNKPSDVLTVTRMTSYERCPRQWGYTYVSGLRSPPGWAMIAGSAMDATLNEHLDQKIKGVNGLRGSALTDYYVTQLRKLVEEQTPVGPKDDRAETDGVVLLPMYEHEVSPKIEPIEVQKEVEYEIGGQKYLGHLDMTRRAGDGAVIISDHKFTSYTPRPDKAAKSLQLRAYDLAINDPSHRVELINLVRLKREPKIIVTPHVVTDQDRRELLMKWTQTAALIDTMIFPMIDPSSWNCNPDSCGFWSRCRGNPRGPEPIPGERGV